MVAVRLMQVVAGDEVVFRRVADLIRSDPAFSAEVMKLANSPLMGCREKISGILHALAILGLDRIKGLVMTVALRNFLSSALQVPVLLRCWRHSLACALLSEDLALASWLDKDRYYTAGLLHDLGRLALLATYPEEYARLLEDADTAEPGAFDLCEAERVAFGADHCVIGRWLVSDWQFPAEFLDVTAGHHAKPPGAELNVLTGVHLGCRIADMLGFQVAGPAALVSFDELKSEFPQCYWARLKQEGELLIAIAGKINALECSLLG